MKELLKSKLHPTEKRKLVNQHRLKLVSLKSVEYGALFVALLIIIVIVAGFFPYSNSLVTAKLQRYIKSYSLDTLVLEKVTITPWKSIEIKNIHFSKRLSSSSIVSGQIDHATFKVNILSLLLWQKNFKEQKELIKITNQGKTTTDRALLSIQNQLNFLQKIPNWRELVCNQASITHKDTLSKLNRSYELISLKCNRSADNSPLEGSFRFKEINLGKDVFKVNNFNGTFSIDSGLIQLSKCKGDFLDGKVKIDSKVNLAAHLFENLLLELQDINLAHIYKADIKNEGTITGILDLEFHVPKSNFQVDSITGNGTITGKHIKISEVPVLKSLASLLSIPSLKKLEFDRIKSQFHVKQRTFTTEMQGFGDQLDFKSAGWIQENGSLNQQFVGTLSKDLVKSLPKEVVATLYEVKDSRREFNCRIYGSVKEPKFEFDKKMIQRAINNVFDNVSKSLMQFFY